MKRPLAALAAVIVVAGITTGCEPPPTNPGVCQYPRSSAAVQVAYDASSAGQNLAQIAGFVGSVGWNAAGSTAPAFGAAASVRHLTISAWNDPYTTTLATTTTGCVAGGYSTATVRVNVGRLSTLANPSGTAGWVGSHEFGHALGLGHIGAPPDTITPGNCPGSVMWWSDETFWRCGTQQPTGFDAAAASKLYD